MGATAETAVRQNVQRIRAEANLTIEGLAGRLGKDVQAVHSLEAGNLTIDAELLRQLARALQVDLARLLEMPVEHVAAGPLVDAFLRSAKATEVAVSAEERAWLEARRGARLDYLGIEPRAEDLAHFVTGTRTLGKHVLDPGKLRVVVVQAEGGPVMRLGEVLVVYDRRDQELNMRYAYALAQSTESTRQGR